MIFVLLALLNIAGVAINFPGVMEGNKLSIAAALFNAFVIGWCAGLGVASRD